MKSSNKRKANQLSTPGTNPFDPEHEEDIFFMGIPVVDSATYERLASAVAARTQRVRKYARYNIESQQDCEDAHECHYVTILAVNALTFSFAHKLSDDTQTKLITFLTSLWDRSNLADLLQKLEKLQPRDQSMLLMSELAAFDKKEFLEKTAKLYNESHKEVVRFSRSLKDLPKMTEAAARKKMREAIEDAAKEMNTARKLYNFLYNKAAWQEELERRTVSYNEKMPGTTGDETEESREYVEILEDKKASGMLERINKDIEVTRVHEIIDTLPPAEKAAVEKWNREEALTETEEKAKYRGMQKIKKKLRA